jgi:hypothetical protein
MHIIKREASKQVSGHRDRLIYHREELISKQFQYFRNQISKALFRPINDFITQNQRAKNNYL